MTFNFNLGVNYPFEVVKQTTQITNDYIKINKTPIYKNQTAVPKNIPC